MSIRSLKRAPPKRVVDVCPEDPVDDVEMRVSDAWPWIDGHDPAGATAIEHVARVEIAVQENLGTAVARKHACSRRALVRVESSTPDCGRRRW